MWIAIRLPQLPLEIFLRGSSTPEPFALQERHRVFACDRKAATRGVRPGMAVSAALALAPGLRLAPRDPAAETEALLGVAGWAAQFAPGVALEFPDAVLLDAAGSLKLFGGLAALLGRLRRELAEMGWSARLAGAPTPRGAFWLALAGSERFVDSEAELEPTLAPLPVAVLRGDGETLETLAAIGARTLGGLFALPREGVARRFGQRLLDDLDRALGRLPDPRNFFVPPPRFRAAIELPAEVAQSEALLFAAKRLIVQLAGFLAARSGGVQRFVFRLKHRRRAATEVVIGLVAPSRDAEHLTLLARERFSSLELAEPAREIALEVDDVAPLAGRNLGLLLEQGKPQGDWERLIERLRARLGTGAVRGIAVRAEHRPELASTAADPGAKQPRLEFGERPIWLLESPRPLAEIGARPHHQGPLELLAGPERIESGWWDGSDVARDYFIARMQNEALVWIYRERGGGGWYLHGLFS
ncbi:MAG TPA: DNA polymerase Y family protein [Burkholderiales bacterium]|nr:DNA polymerase Y family protein [Burkholderiales bacterium]